MLAPILQFLLFVFIYSTAIFLQFGSFADDPGVGWHLATGEWIALHNKIPNFDPFLSWISPKEWISDQWLSDFIFFLIYKAGEMPLLYAFCLSIFCTIFGVLLFQLTASIGLMPVTSALVIALAFKLTTIHFILRPIVFSFLFFTILIIRIIKSERNNKAVSLYDYIICFLLFIFWANCHPSFVIGLFLLGLWIISQIIEKFFLQKDISSNRTNSLILLLIISLAATIINPYGIGLHESIMQLTNNTFFMNLHKEWRPLVAREAAGSMYQYMLFAVVFFSWLYTDTLKKISGFEILAFVAFGSATYNSARFLPYFAIITVPVLATLLGELEKVCFEKISTLFSSPRFLKINNSYNSSMAFIVLPVVLFLLTSFTQKVPGYLGAYGPSIDKFPYKALSFIKNTLNKPLSSVLTTPDWGGFITWEGQGMLKPVIDDRNTLAGEKYYKEVINSFTTVDKAIAYAREKKIDFLIYPLKQSNNFFDPHASDTTLVPPSSNEIYRDDQTIIVRLSDYEK